MQLFLYMCEGCGGAKFVKKDCGKIYYTDCLGCGGMLFHISVSVNMIWGREMGEDKFMFYVEDYNDVKEKGTVDISGPLDK